MVKRKYKESYVSYGFTCITDDDDTQRPQCFICGKVFANCSLRPVKLKNHFQNSHSEESSRDQSSLLAMKRSFEKGKTMSTTKTIIGKKIEASYKIAYRVAKENKPHTIAENLIKPCLLDTMDIFFGEKDKEEISKIPLSNSTIHSRITDMSNNMLHQLMRELKESSFPTSLQLDESTDVSHCCQLLVFVRYVHGDAIKEEFLFCKTLEKTSKGADIFKIIDEFFATENFDWKNKVSSICTDGAPAMLGNKSGFASLVKSAAPTATS